MKILITGSTGLVGKKLGQELVRRGHKLVVVTRSREKALLELPFPADIVEADLTKETPRSEHFRGVQGVIHLMGENVGDGRWTEPRKKAIYDSRVLSLKNLIFSLPEPQLLKTLVSTSATGFYGDTQDQLMDESGRQGTGFLSQICKDWEGGVLNLTANPDFKGLRTVIFRLGVVLSPEGGALAKMAPAFRMHVAGKMGSGNQWMSWIHLDDVVTLFAEAIDLAEYHGIYNAVSPNPVQNSQFSKDLALALTGSAMLGPPVPALALKALMGDMASIILESQRVDCARLSHEKFQFKYPDLGKALSACFTDLSGGYSVYRTEQYFPLPPDKVFEFFAEAHNLEKITPEFLHFKILNVSTPLVQKGTLIDYSLRIHQVPVRWRTEITQWNPGQSFTDSQLKGPYSEWHHTHSFEALGSGTLMKDVVLYKLPLGSLGGLVAGSFVRKDVESIFAYRRKSVGSHLVTP
jgi:uncharacterized protein (TIGR01777 family)